MLLNPVQGWWQLVALGISIALAMPLPAHASRIWNWSYTGAGIAASGTFTTTDAANGLGYYQIVGITGSRNGETITGLQPTGTPIPGNEPYAVDNLIGLSTPQLTVNGFGFSTAAGDFANPFYANFLSSPGYLEFFSAPPLTPVIGPEDSELPVIFAAALTTTGVPEPDAAGLLLVGLTGLVAAGAGRGGLRWSRSMSGTRSMH
jgi:hypothetical protein